MTPAEVAAAFIGSWRRDAEDRNAVPLIRVMAWAHLGSWGRNAAHCVRADGTPATDHDAASDLGLPEQTAWKTLRWLVMRGYFDDTPGLITPLRVPQLKDRPDPATDPEGFDEYMDTWRAADPYGPRRWKAAETRRAKAGRK